MPYPAAIAIDGPVASGKTTVGQALARRLDYRFVDTGVFYRAVAIEAVDRGVPMSDARALGALARALDVQLVRGGEGVRIDGVDKTPRLRTPKTDAAAARVAEIPSVRRALLGTQRALALRGRVVMVGRDIGTTVLPTAAKVYLDASVGERARRRHAELEQGSAGRAAADVRAELEARDAHDTLRAEAPLRAADDAHRIETDGLDVDAVVELGRAHV